MRELEQPMRVLDRLVERARNEVEGRFKAAFRAALLPAFRMRFGAVIDEGFQWGLPLSLPRNACRIGRFVYVGAHGSMLGPVVIGDFCMISSHVRIIGNDHRIDVVGGPTRLEFPEKPRAVTVFEADVWVGQGAMIMEGVRLGRGAVIAAGSVVTRDVAPYAVVGGVPARELRMRFTPEQIRVHDKALFGNEENRLEAPELPGAA